MPIAQAPEPEAPPIAGANPFGLVEALIGLAAAELLAQLAVVVFGALSDHPKHPSSYGSTLADLLGVWTGFFGAVVFASLAWRGWRPGRRPVASEAGRDERRSGSLATMLRQDYGLALRPWPDIPLGVAIGLAAQYGLVWVLEAPLLPFVPHLYQRLGGPAHQLTGTAHGASGLAVLGCFVCIGSPFFEECFFRGLLLRALVGRLAPFGRRVASAGGVVISAVVFGLVHFEALELLGLVGFGVVLGVLARRTGRLGPGIVAHLSFNAVTVIALALAR